VWHRGAFFVIQLQASDITATKNKKMQ